MDEDFENRSRSNIETIIKNFLQKADPAFQVSIFGEIFTNIKKISSGQSSTNIEILLNDLNEGKLRWHSSSQAYYIKKGGEDIYSNADLAAVYDECFHDTVSTLDIRPDLIAHLQFKILSQYFHETMNNYSNQEHIKPLIGRMSKKFAVLEKVIKIVDESFETSGNNLQVVSFRNVNTEMKKVLPLIIAKQLYETQKTENDLSKSLHIIIDEAHNILSRVSERESETWKDYRLETFEEIIKEGRKFGTFLTIASQRPQDISPTIISQLHNYFIHRLLNNHDIAAIEKSVAYLDKLSFQTIPILAVGSCFVAGLASDIPIKVTIDLLPEPTQPASQTVNLQNIWNE